MLHREGLATDAGYAGDFLGNRIGADGGLVAGANQVQGQQPGGLLGQFGQGNAMQNNPLAMMTGG